jgi:hypothetical protein
VQINDKIQQTLLGLKLLSQKICHCFGSSYIKTDKSYRDIPIQSLTAFLEEFANQLGMRVCIFQLLYVLTVLLFTTTIKYFF